MKKLNLKYNQENLRNKFLRQGVNMTGPETIFFPMTLKQEIMLQLNLMLLLAQK